MSDHSDQNTGTDVEPQYDENNLNNSLSTHRRTLLATVGTMVGGSTAGCSFLEMDFQDDMNIFSSQDSSQAAPEQAASSSVLQDLKQAHQEYLTETSTVRLAPSFEYSKTEVTKKENGSSITVQAMPSDLSDGDWITVSPPDTYSDIRQLARLFPASWGAPVNAAEVGSTLYNQQVNFQGGAGPTIAVLAGVGSRPSGERAIFMTRGKNLEIAKNLADDYKEF